MVAVGHGKTKTDFWTVIEVSEGIDLIKEEGNDLILSCLSRRI